METPVEIAFQGMESSPDITTRILEHLAGLEKRYGRVTSGRVVVKAPSARHRTGGLFEVSIWLSLPGGREVSAGRTPPADERHSVLAFALDDAFKRARRQLQDTVSHMRGEVKSHDGQEVAKIARIDRDAGFGFLETMDGREIYFHMNSVIDNSFAKLDVGTKVAFVETEGDKGPQASTVRVVATQGPGPGA